MEKRRGRDSGMQRGRRKGSPKIKRDKVRKKSEGRREEEMK